ncbi:hypothetical protein AgCh_019494 [Apium graveolens]
MNLAKAKFTPRLSGRKSECLKIILSAKPPCRRQIRDALITATIIQPPDWNLSLQIICDASDYAIGAVPGIVILLLVEDIIVTTENFATDVFIDNDNEKRNRNAERQAVRLNVTRLETLNWGTTEKPPPPVMNSGEPVLSKKMARLRRTARKSVPGGPYHVEGFRLLELVVSLSVNIHTVKDPNTIMSDTKTPTKPTKTEESPKTQIQSRYETIRVPILRPSEYPIWKVRMTMFLEATDPEYLDRIKEGPHKPTKLAVAVAGEAAKTVPKEKSDYTAKDIASIAKDAKVRHLLHSAIDNVMSNRVINCKTAKEIWDALEIRCQGTDTIKKNRKTILTQEYEHFDSKTNESLNDLYDRFVKLLNDLSLVDKEYYLEDSNLKFLSALPECWDLKATTIRDNYNLDEITLDEIYGMLKTHELEMEQRSKMKGGKSRTVSLKAEEEFPKAASSKKDKGKALFIKSDTESSSSESDDDSDSESLPETDADEEMMKLFALMVKGITKIAYRKFRKGKKFSRKGISSDKKNFRRSEGRGGKSDRGDYTNVKCYNCGEKGHISPDCKKVKGDKGKALVTKQKSWTDTSDSESEENYALMANADKESAESSSEAAETKVPQTTYAFHTDDINELRRYLKTIRIEMMLFMLGMVLKLNESLKTELEKEKEIIRTWTNSGKTTQNLLSSGNWKEGLGYGEDKKDKGTEEIKSVDKQNPKLKPVKFVTVKSENEKSEVTKESTSDKLK